MKYRVALAQVSASEEKRENLRAGVELVGAASEMGADLVVLPELFMAYVPLDAPPATFVEAAEEVSGEFVGAIASEARRRRVHVVVGIIERSRKKGRVHNTAVMVGPEGRVVATHRKLQLFDSQGYKESDRFEPARTLEGAFETGLGRMGMMTCYELRFPEMARILALQGAELIVVPTAWLAGRMKEDHLHVLARARALENTVYVAVASQTGRIFSGRSLVVDPFGVPICDAGEDAGLVMAEVDTERIARVRKVLPTLEHLRSDVYSGFLGPRRP
ncbi:MAG: carbon-nitrogen hydrolase family protein [Nitrososphaerales archaeon]|jgi:predicted amidohydrolase